MSIENALIERFGLQHNVAMVTGGASGLGKEIAQLLAEAGVAVVIADLNREAAEAAACGSIAQVRRAVAMATDVCDQSSVIGMVAEVIRCFGRKTY